MVSLEFFIDIILPPHYNTGVESASNEMRTRTNSYEQGKGGWWVRLRILPPSCVGFLKIWKSQPSGTLRVCPGPYRECYHSCSYCYYYYLTNTAINLNPNSKKCEMNYLNNTFLI
jgi:hypothetical protein